MHTSRYNSNGRERRKRLLNKYINQNNERGN